MLKILTLLFSFLLGQFRGHHEKPVSYDEIIQSFFGQLNDLLGSLALGLTGLILSGAGFLTAYFNILGQYDMNGAVTLSAVAAGGILLLLIGAGLIYAAQPSRNKASSAFHHKPPEPQAPSPSPLEQALSSLVMDFVKEREHQREMKKSTPETREENSGGTRRPRGTVATFSTEGTGVLN